MRLLPMTGPHSGEGSGGGGKRGGNEIGIERSLELTEKRRAPGRILHGKTLLRGERGAEEMKGEARSRGRRNGTGSELGAGNQRRLPRTESTPAQAKSKCREGPYQKGGERDGKRIERPGDRETMDFFPYFSWSLRGYTAEEEPKMVLL